MAYNRLIAVIDGERCEIQLKHGECRDYCYGIGDKLIFAIPHRMRANPYDISGIGADPDGADACYKIRVEEGVLVSAVRVSECEYHHIEAWERVHFEDC